MFREPWSLKAKATWNGAKEQNDLLKCYHGVGATNSAVDWWSWMILELNFTIAADKVDLSLTESSLGKILFYCRF